MSETTRGNGVIVDRPAASTGTLPRPDSPARQAARVPRQSSSPGGATPRTPRGVPDRKANISDTRVRSQATPRAVPPRPKPKRTPAPPARTQPKRAQAASPRPESRLRTVSPSAANRMPFIVLLCGLLGGALVSTLVISTTLDNGSFEITKLQQSDSSLARQRQQLQDEVAQAQSAPVIQQRAYELGMRPVNQLQFVNLKSGKIESDAGSPNGGPGSAP